MAPTIIELEKRLSQATSPRVKRTLEEAISRFKEQAAEQERSIKAEAIARLKVQEAEQKRLAEAEAKAQETEPEKDDRPAPAGEGWHKFVIGLQGTIERTESGDFFNTEDGAKIPLTYRARVRIWAGNQDFVGKSLFLIAYPTVKDGKILRLNGVKIDAKNECEPFLHCRGIWVPEVAVLMIQQDVTIHKRYIMNPHSFGNVPEDSRKGFCELKLSREGDRLMIEKTKKVWGDR